VRLSNKATERMALASRMARQVPADLDAIAARRLLHAAGAEAYGDALLLAAARGRLDRGRLAAHLDLAASWPIPRLPIGGRDLARFGLTGGREVGRLLAEAEKAWVASDFGLDREALIALVAGKIAR
jgi:poly(A) polymerase